MVLGKPVPPDRMLKLLGTVGGRITVLRHAAGMTQWDLAEKVHVSQSLVSLWERNRVPPDADAVKRLAKVLKSTQSFLLNNPVISDTEAAA